MQMLERSGEGLQPLIKTANTYERNLLQEVKFRLLDLLSAVISCYSYQTASCFTRGPKHRLCFLLCSSGHTRASVVKHNIENLPNVEDILIDRYTVLVCNQLAQVHRLDVKESNQQPIGGSFARASWLYCMPEDRKNKNECI